MAPMVFISHDTRDAKLAEAFATLLKRASSDEIIIFRSSDIKGSEGIPRGEIWFNILISRIEEATDLVCILTTRSIDNPWIFWEAGVAVGEKKPVHSLTIGLSMKDACKGPLAHFQNCCDDHSSMEGLVMTLLSRLEKKAK